MNEHRTVEEKLASGISAVASGLLTNLVCNSIRNAEYAVSINKKEYHLPWIQIEWGNVLFVITVFLLLWALIAVGIPKLFKIRKRFTYIKIRPAREQDLLKTLDSVKKAAVNLTDFFYSETATENPEVAVLYVRELATAILQLHRSFLPYNRKLRKRVRNSFRSKLQAPIQSIGKKVTDYELSALVALLRRCVTKAKTFTGYGPLLKQDCEALYLYLDELETLVKDFNA